MPRQAVAIYLLLALLGAAIFVYCTFPRTRDQIPTSNNQRPFAPPGNVPVPESQPHPSSPSTPHGPTLQVMAWASGEEAQALAARLDTYGSPEGLPASLTLAADEATYRHDLAAALAAGTPPDVCLVDTRDFAGVDPERELATVPADPTALPRSVTAFTVDGTVRAVPAEFTVDLLYYDPSCFDRAGLAPPGPHWNWDILEAMSRAIGSLKLKNGAGAPIYPLEMAASFDTWDLLCTQAGHPVLDGDAWHVADPTAQDAQQRSLDLIHEYFQGYAIAGPAAGPDIPPGRYFGRQQAAMMIGPSALVATLPNFGYQLTELPRDMAEGSLALARGWAVPAQSPHRDAAGRLALFLGRRPLHAGWTGVHAEAATDGFSQICQSVLAASALPRVDARNVALVRYLDAQIDQFARQPGAATEPLLARIQAEYAGDFPEDAPKVSNVLKPRAIANSELHDP